LLETGHEVAVFHRGKRDGDLPRPIVHIHGDRKRLHESAHSFATFLPQVVVDLIAFTEAEAQSTIQIFGDRAERLVCASSMDVYQAYGSFRRLEISAPRSRPLPEDAPLRRTLFPYRALAKDSNDPLYDYEKILVERTVMNNARLAAVVLRLPQVFGPHDPQRRLSAYLKQMDAHQNIMISEAKAEWRWTRGYVEDIAFGFVLAAIDPKALGRIYNIGEEEGETEIAWIRRIGKAAGWQGRVRVVPGEALPKELAEPYDWSHDLAGDTGLIRRQLGYGETVSAKEAMERSVRWERSQS